MQHKSGARQRQLDRVEGGDCRAAGHAVRGRQVRAGDQGARDVSLQPAQGAVYYKDLAPKRLLGDGSDLPGHPEGELGGRHDPAHRPSITAGTPLRGRAGRPAGRGGGHAVQGEL